MSSARGGGGLTICTGTHCLSSIAEYAALLIVEQHMEILSANYSHYANIMGTTYIYGVRSLSKRTDQSLRVSFGK